MTDQIESESSKSARFTKAYQERNELKAKVPSITGNHEAHHEAQMKVFAKEDELATIYPASIEPNPTL